MRFVPGFGGVQQNLNGTQTYSNNEGSVTVGTGAGMPSGWPNDVPANYSGASIVYSGNLNPQTGQAGVVVSYTVQGATAQAVADYYKAGLISQGWAIEGDVNMAGGRTIVANKADKTFGVSIVEAGGMVNVTAGLEL